ncbi:MAG TPA: YceI family protein [Gemmatimonadaceae bacterium]|nr:YceI family protein [Gemmatimonadaceae bacterium]
MTTIDAGALRAVRYLAACVGVLASVPGAVSAQAPASDTTRRDSVIYRLIPDSRFEVTTSKAGLFGFAGHEHLVRARSFNGVVVYFPANPATSHLELSVPAESLEVLTPPDTAEIRQVTATMRTEVLHVAEYPEIRFTATGGPPTDKGMRLQGELTLLGQTRPVKVDVVLQVGADTLRASGNFSVKQTDFGITPYSGGPAGTVKVGDRVRFEIDAIAVRTAASASDHAGTSDRRER